MEVGGHQCLQGILDCVAPQADHPHVGDVKQAAVLAHGPVFGHQTGELQGHLPAREGHHAPPGRLGCPVEGGAPQKGVAGQVGHGSRAPRIGGSYGERFGPGSVALPQAGALAARQLQYSVRHLVNSG